MDLIRSQVPNQTTQPVPTLPVFNNAEVVADGWYFVDRASALGRGKARGYRICGQELVFYRGEDGAVRALDAYCPHMGTHLGVGKVVGNQIRCFFHHWRFDEEGRCTDVPCQKEIPAKARLRPYAVCEKYGALWVHPGENPPPLSDFREFRGQEVTVVFGAPYERACHHHVTMINGIDPQHLKTVHRLDIEMEVELAEDNDGRRIDITLTGQIGDATLRERLARALLGRSYAYSMRYDHANNGFLTLMKDIRLFGTGPLLPTLSMIFAYRPLGGGRTLVQPIYVTRRRRGLLGSALSRVLIELTRRAFFALQGEDGRVYENMRFFPANLLPMDRPVAQYIQYVNKLRPSVWKG